MKLADRIHVFQRSRIAGEETHAELVALGGLYARVFLAQAGPNR